MTFDADAEAKQAEEDYKPFPFTWRGETYFLPHPFMLTTGQAEKLIEAEASNDEAKVLAFFSDLAPEAMTAIREMPGGVTAKLFDQWREGYGELGKSDSEPSQPNRAARRSKQTSKSAASTSGG